jgi:signal transduction histidine kinase
MAAGGLSAALGGVVVVGWLTGSVRLIQTHPDFPPMQFNTALGFLTGGVGLMAALAGRPVSALVAGLLALSLGALSLLESLAAVDLGINRLFFHSFSTTLTSHAGRIPPNSAVCLLLAGVAILALRRTGTWPHRPLALAILGTILMALGLVAYVGHVADLPGAYGWGRFTRMAVQSAIGFFILGGGLLAAAWQEAQSLKEGLPAWLPIPLGTGLCTAVACLWHALTAQPGPRAASYLSAIALSGGLAMAAFVAWTLHLFQTARRRAREAESASRGLLDEVADHHRTMGKLALRASELEQSLNSMKTEARIILSILNSMGDGVVVTDPEGKILLFNPEAERLLGLGTPDAPPAEWPAIYGLYRSDQTTPLPAEELPFARALRGENVDGLELFIRNPGATGGHWASVGGRPLCNARGDVQGTVIVLRDVTAYKTAERMKDEFVSIVSHELRTPLTAIKGALGLLLGGAAGEIPGKAGSMLDVAHRNSDRLMRLINDILDIQKIESGRMEFTREPVDVMRIVKHGIEATADYAKPYGVALVLTQRLPGARVVGDADRLGQVLVNLLSNAIKFSPPSASVEVAVSRQDSAIRVSVTDRGPGVPAAFRDRIFQKFAQADATDSRQKGGTGLGLSICKAIIERLDGRIGYESEPGVRTTFYFDLPEAKPA